MPVPTFRSKDPAESEEGYARALVAFYLNRIKDHTGEYFPNVWSVMNTKGSVPALIETMYDEKTGVRPHAEALLKEIHHPLDGRPNAPVLPDSRQGWYAWWQETGSSQSTTQLWSNFDSHYQ